MHIHYKNNKETKVWCLVFVLAATLPAYAVKFYFQVLSMSIDACRSVSITGNASSEIYMYCTAFDTFQGYYFK